MEVTVLGREKMESWERYLLKVEKITKRKGSGVYRVRYGKIYLWIPSQQVKCGCPKLKENEKYLLMGKSSSSSTMFFSGTETITDSTKPGLVFNHHTLVLPYDPDLEMRLERFSTRELHGFCSSARHSIDNNSI